MDCGTGYICCDCSSVECHWASLNRGVMLCDDCCSIHLNLGRHISIIRSLKYGHWDGSQLELMQYLYRNGSNRIWESIIPNSTNSKFGRKPIPTDPTVPIKEDFIFSKYLEEAFTKKNIDEEADDINKQLLACVRTGHVETTLRLLALGADPFSCEAETENSCLHIAAREGQNLQIELLFLYGADPLALNKDNQTPRDLAALRNNKIAIVRLDELSHYLTDQLSLFLIGRKPRHDVQSYLIPEMINTYQQSQTLADLRSKINDCTDEQLLKIVQDVYDEIDRRQVLQDWIRSRTERNIVKDAYSVPFLPLIPFYSALRNQCRQKIAKLDGQQFSFFVLNILTECQNRIITASTVSSVFKVSSSEMCTSAHLYNDDDVEYDIVPEVDRSIKALKLKVDINEFREGNTELETNKCPINIGHVRCAQNIEILVDRLQLLSSAYDNLKREMMDNKKAIAATLAEIRLQNQSTYETSNIGVSKNNQQNVKANSNSDVFPKKGLPVINKSPDVSVRFSKLGEKDKTSCTDLMPNSDNQHTSITREKKGMSHYRMESSVPKDNSIFPENLIRATEQLTVQIRRLVQDSQVGLQPASATTHAEIIGEHVLEIINYIPPEIKITHVAQAVENMWDCLAKLCCKCNSPNLNSTDTCNAAFQLAQATKTLLVLFTS